ncbi:MAG: hypothetical protein A3B82_01655 [Methylophilales bacterium RIFCSPHIGHO2_02_FULL_57_10]|nr:MAG: hypothetical protein A3B82_01655 [Methylophilales bacterium RIFCSPHIGHO2_02_FULL_57_10]
MDFPENRTLTQSEFECMCRGADVLEQDSRGIKVLRLADGDMLKLFRVKRAWSSARLIPYSKRFCRNAARLAQRGIPTVSVKAWYQLGSPGTTAVLYRPLPGLTIREIARSGGLGNTLLQQLGAFVAELHRQGVYFRSLHFGNIVQTPEGKLGLIDIADLGVRPWRLFNFERLRNFRHLCRLERDRQQFGQQGWQRLCSAYLDATQMSARCRQKFAMQAQKLFDHGGTEKKS